MPTRSPRTRLLLLLAVFSAPACASEEERICKQELAFEDATALFGGKPPGPDHIKQCVETFALVRDKLKLDDAAYAEFKQCRAAAKSLSESLTCTAKVASSNTKKEIDAAFAPIEKKGDEELARLEALVSGGAIDAATIAAMRANRASTPPGRFVAIADDARALIEAGRVAPGNKVTIQLPPGLDNAMKRPGSMAAEIVFVDAKTSRTVARIAPIAKTQFGTKDDDIAALLKWACEDPDHRDVELEVTSGGPTGITFDPPKAIGQALDALTEAGLDERPLIRLDGKPMTAGEWAKSQ